MIIGKNSTYKVVCLFILGLLFSSSSFATPNLVTFQSRIVKPDGKALEGSSVSFRFSITDALGTCVIYQEDFANRNMSGTKGLINLNLGGGTKVYPLSAMDLSEVFNNYNFPTFNCQSGGTVNAGATDRRRLVMQFNDGSGWQTVPAMDINSNPYALQAAKAYSLGDYPAADYLRTVSLPTCNAATHALTFNGTNFTCLAAGGAGAGTVTNVTSANADIAVATGNSTPQLTLNSGTGAGQIVKLNVSAELPAVSGVNLTLLNATNLGSGTVPAARMPALTGDVTTAAGAVATTIAGNAITSAKILDDEIVNADIKSNAAIARSKIAASAAGGIGDVLINDGSGMMSSLQCANGEVIKFDGAGNAICGSDLAGTGDIVNGGNATGSTVTVGTNDAQSFVLETNNTPKVTILSNGNVGIGTATPSGILEVQGGTAAALTSGSMLRIQGQHAGAGGANSGGHIQIIGGNSVGSSSAGIVALFGGVAGASGFGGNVTLNGGSGGATFGNGGSVYLNAGIAGVTEGDGGSIFLTAKNSTGDGNAGSIKLVAGTKTGAGNDGNIQLMAGSVGVGTTTPQRLLHVNGPMRITPSAVPAAPAAGDMYVDSGDSNKLKIYDGGAWVAAGGSPGGVTNVSSANTDIGVANGGTTPVLTLNAATTGADKIVRLKNDGTFDAISGANLTNLNASALGSGIIPAGRFPAFTGDVTTLAGGVVTTLSDDAVSTSKIQLGAVTDVKLAANSVTSAKILDDEIVDADIKSSAAISRSKLANGNNDHVLINTAGGVMASEAQLAVTRGGTGLSSYTNNALIMANVTGTALTNATCSPGELLLWSGVTWACTNMATSAQGFFKDGGNTFTGTATIGTNSNHNLEIETNGTTKMTLLANGNVGVGVAVPNDKLQVNGGTISVKSDLPTNAPAFYNNAGYVTGLYGIGMSIMPYISGTSTVTNIFGVSIDSPTTAGGSFGNYVGVNIVGTTSGTASNKGIVSALSSGANNWNIFASGTAKNYFAGDVGIGTISPETSLDVAGDRASVGVTSFGHFFKVRTGTVTSTVGISGLTHSNGSAVSFHSPVFASTDTSTTISNAYSVLVTGAPASGANTTLTNSIALGVGGANVGAQTNSYGLFVNAQTGATNNYAAVFNSGNVGIGTTAPASKLHVAGGALTTEYSAISSLTVDFLTANTIANTVAAGTLVLNNLKNGTNYTLIVQNTGTYTLTSPDISTWRCAPACPGGVLTNSSGHVLISILRAGTNAYVSYVTDM